MLQYSTKYLCCQIFPKLTDEPNQAFPKHYKQVRLLFAILFYIVISCTPNPKSEQERF